MSTYKTLYTLFTDPSETSRGHRQSPRGGDATVFGADVTAAFLRKNELKVFWDIFVYLYFICA